MHVCACLPFLPHSRLTSAFCVPPCALICLLSQNMMSHLSEVWGDLIEAESSVLINVFHCPMALFPLGSRAFKEAKDTFIMR